MKEGLLRTRNQKCDPGRVCQCEDWKRVIRSSMSHWLMGPTNEHPFTISGSRVERIVKSTKGKGKGESDGDGVGESSGASVHVTVRMALTVFFG